METNVAARLYSQMLNHISKTDKEPIDLSTGGFLKRPPENTSIDANDVAGRAAHYFSQIYNERKKFNEDRNG